LCIRDAGLFYFARTLKGKFRKALLGECFVSDQEATEAFVFSQVYLVAQGHFVVLLGHFSLFLFYCTLDCARVYVRLPLNFIKNFSCCFVFCDLVPFVYCVLCEILALYSLYSLFSVDFDELGTVGLTSFFTNMFHYTTQFLKAEMRTSYWTGVLLMLLLKVNSFVVIHFCSLSLPLRLLHLLILRRVHKLLGLALRLGD